MDYPAGGEVIGGMIPIQWSASDTSELSIKIEYKNDTATEWTLIADDEENDGMYKWDATALEKGEQFMIKITATDAGGNSSFIESGLFEITQLIVTPKTAQYNETSDIHVESTSGWVQLCKPDGTIKAEEDGSPGDVWFFNINFDETGMWYVNDDVQGMFYIWIAPIDLTTTASPTEVTFAKSGTESYIAISGTVENPDGTPTSSAIVEVWAPGDTPSVATTPIKTTTTDATGQYNFTDKVRISLYGAGVYNISARIGDIDDAFAFGYATMTVNPTDVNVSLYSMGDVKGGFPEGEIVFSVTFMDDTALLPEMQEYNVSIWKDGELYDWHDTSDGSTADKINFADPYGKYLNLTPVEMWEAGDDYTLKVEGDFKGDSSLEYSGEVDFEIIAAPNVNVFVTPDKMDVKDEIGNKQTIEIKIYGEDIQTFGNYSNLGIDMGTNKNVTKRIAIDGDILYAPPASAYTYDEGTNTWTVYVFPTKGEGTIYVDVTWPDKGTAEETVDIVKGGYTTVDPTMLIVDTATTIEVKVWASQNIPIYNANVTLVYEADLYEMGTTLASTEIADANGTYIFEDFESTQPDVNIIVIATFEYQGSAQYAYALIKSMPAHDLELDIDPATILVGRTVEFTVNITRGGESYANDFEFYVVNGTELQDLQDGELELVPADAVYIGDKANDTFDFLEMEPGTYYVYLRTADKKHDNMENEPSFEVTKATVTANPTKLVKYADINKTVVFTVTWNGEALNGTLKVMGIKPTSSYEGYAQGFEQEVEIMDGEGNLTNVTAVNLGDISFEFMPEETGSTYAEADGILPVVAPEIDVTPETVLLFEENLITLTVKHPVTGQGIEGLTVWADITGTQRNLGETDGTGNLAIGIVPIQTGYITLSVGRGNESDSAGNITVWIGLKIDVLCTCGSNLTVRKGTELTILVTTRGGSPVADATVKIGGTTIGTTDSNGEIEYEFEDDGTYEITAEKTGYTADSKTLIIEISDAGAPGFELIALVLGALAAILLIRKRRKQ
jgi:hypothetical protein